MLKIIASKHLIDHVIQAIHITDEKIEPQRRPVFLEGILRLITVMDLNWGLCPALFLSGTKKYLSVKWRLTFLALSWILFFFFFFLSFWGLGIFTGRTEGLNHSLVMLKLKLQYFGHLMRRADSLKKTLMVGKIEGREEKEKDEMVGWHHQLNGHEFKQTLGDSEGQRSLACWVHGIAKSQTRFSDQTTTIRVKCLSVKWRLTFLAPSWTFFFF